MNCALEHFERWPPHADDRPHTSHRDMAINTQRWASMICLHELEKQCQITPLQTVVLHGSVRFCMTYPCSLSLDSKQPGHHLEWILFRFATCTQPEDFTHRALKEVFHRNGLKTFGVNYSLHYTALHYTTLHYTTLHYTTLHYTTLQASTL